MIEVLALLVPLLVVVVLAGGARLHRGTPPTAPATGAADRVLVVCEGRLTADMPREDATAEAVMHAATHRDGHTAGGAHHEPHAAEKSEVSA